MQSSAREPLPFPGSLTSVFLYCEYLNEAYAALCRNSLAAEQSAPPKPASILAEARTRFPRWLEEMPRDFWGQVEIEPSDEVFEPLEAEVRRAPPRWPASTRNDVWTYESFGRSLSTRPLDGGGAAAFDVDGAAEFQNARIWICRELIDPVSAVQEFVARAEGPRFVDHFIQLWIKRFFGKRYRLHFHADIKYALVQVTRRLNELFYTSSVPPSRTAHQQDSEVVGASLVLAQVAAALERQLKTATNASHREHVPEIALSLYLVLRFSRILRVDYRWIEISPGGGDPRAAPASPRRSISAAHPVEYTYFKIRAFGDLTGIPGLNSILRGGILPHSFRGRSLLVRGGPGTGKTVFALQLMADMASRGRFAVYFSLEESYELIQDRIVTYTFDSPRYDVVYWDAADLEREIERYRHSSRGLLMLYRLDPPASKEPDAGFDLIDAMDRIARECEKVPRFGWRALAIDSIDPVYWEQDESSPTHHRIAMRGLVSRIETDGYLGLVITTDEGHDGDVLAGLCDTVLEMRGGSSGSGRSLEFTKSRPQNFQVGPHPLHIRDGQGMQIYPSLAAVRSRLSRRDRIRGLESYGIPLPAQLPRRLDTDPIPEASSALIFGPTGSGKTALALNLITAPASLRRSLAGTSSHERAPSSVLYATFRTPEKKFQDILGQYPGLEARWEAIPSRRLRWYAPGDNMTAPQLVNDVWLRILEAKRAGQPIERVVFDETETARRTLPLLASEPLVWSVLVELFATEGVAAFFVVGEEQGDFADNSLIQQLGEQLDYGFRLDRSGERGFASNISVARKPSLTAPADLPEAGFNVDSDGFLTCDPR